MKIGEVANHSGLTPKTIRYYEDIGLLSAPRRSASGYRVYDQADQRRMVFLRHARQVGFSTDDCRQLLALYEDPERRSTEVHALVADKLRVIEQQLSELNALHTVLQEMSTQCANDHSAQCAIIDSLANPLAVEMSK
ncbi:MAG: MerR family transcriptional regulator [Porticoccaceae bacterium]